MQGQETDPRSVGVDEQLGSPGWTFEKGWLAGVVLGLTAIVVAGRRHGRRRTARYQEQR